MDQSIVKLKENYVKDTEQIRHNISTTQERINKEKNKLANHQRKFDKAQPIKSYLFDDSGSLDVSSEVDVSSSAKDETSQSTSSHYDVDDNPFADANRHS